VWPLPAVHRAHTFSINLTFINKDVVHTIRPFLKINLTSHKNNILTLYLLNTTVGSGRGASAGSAIRPARDQRWNEG